LGSPTVRPICAIPIAQVDRVARGLIVRTDPEKEGIAGKRDIDGFGRLDLAERVRCRLCMAPEAAIKRN
jgi:hypothetical protein